MADAGGLKGETTVQELTRLQQSVARRMAESKATAPDFSLSAEVAMDAAVRSGHDAGALVVKACALALRDHPRANGAYRDGRYELYSRVNVGVVVAGQDALVVPTVLDADRKSVAEIASETRALTERVRDGVVTPPELAGGTFTVFDVGAHGVRRFTPVLNPPQAAILGVGAVEERPVVVDGRLAVGHRLDLTLVCDHRILHGPAAAAFLAGIRARLEDPASL